MKKALSVILAIMLFAVCFTACSESPAETKTDAKPVENANSVVVSQVEGSANSPNGSTPQQETAGTDEQPSSPANLVTSQPIAQNNTSIPSQDVPHTDQVEQSLIFSTLEQMERFLEKGTAHNENETAALNAFKTQKQNYLRPAISAEWQLQKIELYGDNYVYYFDFDNIVNTGTFGCDLLVSIFGSDSLGLNASHFDFMKNKQGSRSLVLGGIEYVYCINTDGSYGIAWKQNELYHSAILSSHTDQIEEILPLLKVERISLQSNSDHVTQ